MSANSTTSAGGGIGCTSAGHPTFLNCRIEGNQATTTGGGLYVADTDGLEVNGCIIKSNSTTATSGTRGGGGVWIKNVGIDTSEFVRLTSCTIDDNSTANGFGGGIHYERGHDPANIRNCVFTGNVANNGKAAGSKCQRAPA